MVLDVAAFFEIAPFVVTVVTSRGKVDKSWRTPKLSELLQVLCAKDWLQSL